jgi:hypothetical protein
MTKPASLGRLCEISKQRSIRKPLLIPVSEDHLEELKDASATKVEWPIRK